MCDGQKVLQAARKARWRRICRRSRHRLAPLDEVLDTYARSARRRRRARAGHRSRRSGQCRDGSGRGARRAARTARDPHAARGDHRARERVGAAAAAAAGRWPMPIPRRVADPAFAAALGRRARGRRDQRDGRREVDRRGGGLPPCSAVPTKMRRVPSLTGGEYEGLPASADADLRGAIAKDLRKRLARLVDPGAGRRTMRWRRSIRTMAATDARRQRRRTAGRMDLRARRRRSGGGRRPRPPNGSPRRGRAGGRLSAAAACSRGRRWLAPPTRSSTR